MQATLTKAWTTFKALEKWQNSAWGKKLAARAAKAATTDFERFEIKQKKQSISKKLAGGKPKAAGAKAKAVKA